MGTTLYRLFRHVQPKRIFLSGFRLKKGIDLSHFVLKQGMFFTMA